MILVSLIPVPVSRTRHTTSIEWIRRDPANPYTEVMATVDPFGNCDCGLKEPETTCADASLAVPKALQPSTSRELWL